MGAAVSNQPLKQYLFETDFKTMGAVAFRQPLKRYLFETDFKTMGAAAFRQPFYFILYFPPSSATIDSLSRVSRAL